MNRLVPRLLAFVALLAVAGVTFSALRDSSRWRSFGRGVKPVADEPYRNLATMLDAHADSTASPVPRNPFAYAEVRVAVAPRRPVVTPKPAEPVVEVPVLTAIVSDSDDPQAVIHYQSRDFTLKAGGLFVDWRVISVTSDEVILENTKTGQRLVLQRPKKGE